jgi:hypothetical protein
MKKKMTYMAGLTIMFRGISKFIGGEIKRICKTYPAGKHNSGGRFTKRSPV